MFDAAGKERLSLDLLKDGTPSMVMCDAKGRMRLAQVVFVDGSPTNMMYDASGTKRLGIELQDGTMPAISLSDDKQRRLLLSVSKSGDASANVMDAEGNLRACLVGGHDQGSLWMYDGKGKGRATLDVGSDSTSLKLLNADGKVRLSLFELAAGMTGLALFDPAEKMRYQLDCDAEGGAGECFYGTNGSPAAAFGVGVDGTPVLSLNRGAKGKWSPP